MLILTFGKNPNGLRGLFSGGLLSRWTRMLASLAMHRDFNEISSTWEKKGGLGCSSSCIEGFQKTISDCALIDLEFKGNSFTWTITRKAEANIRERLDRAMANVEWRRKFPKAQVFHDVIFGSDHCPLIIDLCVPLKKIPRYLNLNNVVNTPRL